MPPNSPSKPDINTFKSTRRQAVSLGTAALLGSSLVASSASAASPEMAPGAVEDQTAHQGDAVCRSCAHWQDTADRVAVADVIMRERLARETHNWADEATCFHPVSIVEVSWFKGTGAEFIEAGRKNPDTEGVHSDSMSPGVVWVNNDRAIADTACAVHTFSQLGGIDVSITSYTRLLWRVQRLNGQWLIAGLRGIYIRDTLIPRNPNQVPKLDEEKLATFRTSYRYLSYMLTAAGWPAHGDLPGVDQPEGVAALRAGEREWLGQSEK